MNSGKTASLLMVADNYLSQGRDIIILKPDKDTRWERGEVKSRAIVTSRQAHLVNDAFDLYDFVKERAEGLHAVLVDEAQFLTREQIFQLTRVVDELDLPVLCYGLRCSYNGNLFEGSAALMFWADAIEEIKTVCTYCKGKATHNLLRIDGVPLYEGDFVVMGDISGDRAVFAPVCRRHYRKPPSPQ